MNRTFDFDDHEGILETATQKVFLAAEITALTTQTNPAFEYARPRASLIFFYDGPRGQYFPLKDLKPEAGFAPDKGHEGRMQITLVTKPDAKEHGLFKGAIRRVMATIANDLTAIFAADPNAYGKAKYFIQSIKAEATDPNWALVDGYYQSDIVYSYRFSQNHIYTYPTSLDLLRAEMGCDSNVNAGICNCTDPAPVSAIMRGAPGAQNQVALQIDGWVEGKTYNGGENDGAYFQIGGDPAASTYNIAKIDVSAPAQTYYLNRNFAPAPPYQSYRATIPINTGATVTLALISVDGRELRNTAGVENPGVPGILPNQGQWIQAVATAQAGGFEKQTVTILDVNDPEIPAEEQNQ